MKKLVFFGSLVALSGILNAQNTFPSTGNTGIGTNSPAYLLEITAPNNPGYNYEGIKINSNTTGHCGLFLKNYSVNPAREWNFWALGTGHSWGQGNMVIHDGTSTAPNFLMATGGNIGIGTAFPQAKLDVGGKLRIQSANVADKTLNILDNSIVGPYKDLFNVYGVGAAEIFTRAALATDYVFAITDPVANTKNFTVRKNGSTSIAGDYIPAGYVLSVNGAAIFTDVWVKARTAWPDYVFKKEYKLMTLDILESYIKKNHHLPNVPSANQIEKAGANLGEMSKIQMEKIEELTLYVIELKKEIDAIKKANK